MSASTLPGPTGAPGCRRWGELTSLRFLTVESNTRRSQLRYNLATSTAVVPVGINKDNDYEFAAILRDQRLRPSTRPWLGAALGVAETKDVDPLILQVKNTPGSAMSKLFVLAHYLRSEGRYSNGGPGETKYRSGHDLDRLVKGLLPSSSETCLVTTSNTPRRWP